MQSSPRSRILVVAALLVVAGGGVAAYLLWPRTDALPEPGTEPYEKYLRAFQVGAAALDTPQKDVARTRLDLAVQLVPAEPAGWANRGLLSLRESDLKNATLDLNRAAALAPDSGEIHALLGFLAERLGKLSEAVAHFRAAVEQDPQNIAALFTLADAIGKEKEPESELQSQQLMEKILKIQPNNLPVLIERALIAFRRKDMGAFQDTLARYDQLARNWNRESRGVLDTLHKATAKTPQDVPFLLQRLDNVLKAEQGYSLNKRAVSPQPETVGAPVQHFLRLKTPRATPAPPDRELGFAIAPWTPAGPVLAARSRWDLVRPLWLTSLKLKELDAEDKTNRFGGLTVRPAATFKAGALVASGSTVRRADIDAPALAFPGGKKNVSPSAAGVLVLDWNNDFQSDLLLAGAGGLRFWQGRDDDKYDDVTKQARLAAALLDDDYFGAWAVDIEMDGDLDIIAARRSGAPVVLRNNGKNRDGISTFTPVELFGSVKSALDFAWGDFDNDGAPDAAFIDGAGELHVFANERAGRFAAWPLPKDLGTVIAITVADVNDDGVLDLVALAADGRLLRISDQDKRKSWQVEELARLPKSGLLFAGTVTLLAGDLDNNGAVDFVVSGPGGEAYIFLADEHGKLSRLPDAVPMRVFAIMDIDGNGRLDLLGLSADGEPVKALNRGRKDYHSRVFWPLASTTATGDNRINTFGIGGEIELRAGMLVLKQPITSPVIHFGLGEQTGVDVVRVVWPNSVAQLEFDVPEDRVLAAEQRLTGSCPFLFTYDGAGIRFAGDFMWGTPLGMYVNGQNTGDFPQTTEWLKIPGEHLVPRDGYYDVRVHANLWEADYFDQLGLIVVDHPADTEIYVDERFFLTPTPPQLYVTTPAKPVARAWDHHGQDATDLVRAIDGRYLDRCGRGQFQGITNDHWVEADLGDDAPTDGPVYLIARGWIHPTNSSINVAISQGDHTQPRPLVLEVPDGKGGWKVGRPALGFPAGKDKTMLIRLDGIEGKGVSRRFRLRTNMEIFWDFLGYARGLDSKLARLQRPAPISADLRYRGILEMTQKDASSPELPHYDRVTRGFQPWRDLTGYYTRFGDVRELVAKVDDRYVIANAGDEIAFRFPVPAGPPQGWKRDFIWECDGWTKDGDLNTRHGNTVLPLPAHGVKMTDAPPARLEDDPVYRRFPDDWRIYHTRYVTDGEFARGLRTFRRR